MMPVAICQCIEKAAMPWFTRFEGHPKLSRPLAYTALLDDREERS
jgi:hypothetical protein